MILYLPYVLLFDLLIKEQLEVVPHVRIVHLDLTELSAQTPPLDGVLAVHQGLHVLENVVVWHLALPADQLFLFDVRAPAGPAVLR